MKVTQNWYYWVHWFHHDASNQKEKIVKRYYVSEVLFHSAIMKCFSVSLLSQQDLCYLQELDVILCVWKLLQLSVSPPQIIDLLLQSLQSSFSSTHCLLFLISDQPYQLRAASLNGADELSKDPLTVLHCCLCRALLGHTVIQASVSLNWDWDKLLFFSRLTLWDSTASLSCWRSFSLCWILCWNVFCVSFSCFCRTNRW